MDANLDSLPRGEPGWIHAGVHTPPCPPDVAATFLNELEPRDLDLVLLAYGLGLRLGDVSRAMGLDPAVAVFRMHRAFWRWRQRSTGDGQGPPDPAALERGVAGVLAGRLRPRGTPPAPGRRGFTARELLVDLDPAVRQRLAESLTPSDRRIEPGSGLGVGLVAVVLAVALGFLVFGALRDVNPMWKGNGLMREFEYARALEVFRGVGTTEARVRGVLCLLAEGRFGEAHAALEDPDVARSFLQFAPAAVPGPVAAVDPANRALLPRGLVTLQQPRFVLRAGPPATLVMTIAGRELRTAVPESRAGPDMIVVDYPAAWPALVDCRADWYLDDGTRHEASFDVADQATISLIRDRNRRMLSQEVPVHAQSFLRGQHFLREGLLVQAGGQFARLAEAFPAEESPRQQVWAIAAALGVDPAALLR